MSWKTQWRRNSRCGLLAAALLISSQADATETAAEPDASRQGELVYLVRQEIPRNTLPVLLTLVIMVLGWTTPLGPIVTVLSSATAIIFLAWDNTDLVPARRLRPFSKRFAFLLRHLGFHLGFGLVFLIPGLNVVFLSFAPVGGTLWYIEMHNR